MLIVKAGDTSVSTGSWGEKQAGLNSNTTAETNFSPTAYVSGDIIFTGNSAGARRSAMQCLYKAKT